MEEQTGANGEKSLIETAPGGYREGSWHPFGKDAVVRVDLRRGWDCRVTCEHVPPQPNEGGKNHGQSGDDWNLALRRGDMAVLFQLFSWIRNGKRMKLPRLLDEKPLLYGAYVSIHDGRKETEGERKPCHLLTQGGQCVSEVLSLFTGERLWGEEQAKLIEALALQPIDKIDLDAAVRALEPFWPKLIALLDDAAT